MKRVSEYKNFICLILSFFVLIIGICLVEKQADSSFALENTGLYVQSIQDSLMELREKLYASESESVKDFLNRSRGRMNPQRLARNGRSCMTVFLPMIIVEDLGTSHREKDVELCQPDHLAAVFTVFYIHHQDGV